MGKKGNTSKGLTVPSSSLKKRDEGSDLESIQSSLGGDYQSMIDEDELVLDASTTVDAFDAHITAAMDKDNTIRFSAVEQIIRVFRYAFLPDIAEKHAAALCEIMEKGLRRTPEEQERALRLAAVLTLQLGLNIEERLEMPIEAMCTLLADEALPEALRTASAEVLGICTYFGIYRPKTRLLVLDTLRSIWSTMKLSTQQHRLFSTSVLAWVLLLERCQAEQIEEQINGTQLKLCWYLGSNSPDTRVAVGEALAVLFELAVDNFDEDFRFSNHPQLKNTFDELAADAVKYHAKRDKRTQKFTFRQITDAIFNSKQPSTTIRFNTRETLEIEGCHSRLLYDFLCHILRGDINTHLTRNAVLRALFDLGAVLEAEDTLASTSKSKSQKAEKRQQFDVAEKSRNIRRGKQRDKRNKGIDDEE